ncbi:MAG: choice-of-anchor B family protein [Bacteroidota bacterium]|nr:choice-of-anchor B family protein [Bacteroidota bacterium]
MKTRFNVSLLALLISFSLKAQYSKLNVELVGHWFNPLQTAEPTYGIKYNGCWAWVDSTDGMKEYAILGSGSGTHIIDLSNPSVPVEKDYVPGRRSGCIWREYKTYGKYLYAISDDASPNSFQIIDMSYLPDSVHVVYDGTTIFERAHTLFIDGDKLYFGSVTLAAAGGYYSMAVYSLANPEVPVLLRQLNQDFAMPTTVHDMLVRNDTVYASGGFDGLFFFHYNTTTNTFNAINSLTAYPEQGYNHSSALTTNGRTLVFCDEVPRDLAVKVLDVSDLSNISVDALFRSANGPTAHNPYISGNQFVFISYYQDGLQIYDISNPLSPVRTGFFDTDTLDGPANNYNLAGPTYHGNWGAYIDLPSKLIIAGDMQNGLYILDASVATGVSENNASANIISLYPNPADNEISILIRTKQPERVLIETIDITGRIVQSSSEQINQGASTIKLNCQEIAAGIYVLKISGSTVNYSGKFVKK